MKGNDAGTAVKPHGDSAGKKNGMAALGRSYTVLFVICALLAFLPYMILGRSFVYRVDGASQYIVYLRYMGQYLREWISRMSKGIFVPVMYDYSIGMGDDVNAIIRFHPLDYLSVFVPGKWTEYLYDAILLIRYYLSGLSFCVFAFRWKKIGMEEKGRLPYPVSQTGILSGAMVYVFCGYMLQRVMNHPTYAAPYIILPILLLAAEDILRKKGVLLFPLAVFLGFVSNYYFMYICSIALLVYVLLRLPEYLEICARQGKRKIPAFFSLFFRMVALYLLGLGMSLVTLLPTLIRYLSSYRTTQTVQRQNLFVYMDVRRYGAWFANLITPFVSSGNGTNLNYAVIVYPAVVMLLFFCRGKLRVLKRVLLLELICLLVPLGGYIMAFFNNENNRWMFLISLALGMTVAFMADAFVCLDEVRQKVLASSGVVFLIVSAVIIAILDEKTFAIIAVLELAACLAVLIGLGRRNPSSKAVRRAVLLITCLSTVVNAWMTFLPGFGNTAVLSEEAGSAYRRFEKGGGEALSQVKGDGFFRIDSSSVKAGRENAGIYFGYNGISMYNSILNADLIQSMLEVDNIGLDSITHLQDLDGRFPSESLAGCRYYVTKKKGCRPFGFTDQPVQKIGSYYVYENELALEFAYGYDSVILKKDYEKLDSVEKELVKLHAALVDEEDLPKAAKLKQMTQTPEEILTVEIPLPEEQEGLTRTGNTYYAQKRHTILHLPYEKKPGYLCLLSLKGFWRDRVNSSYIRVSTGTLKKRFYLRGPENLFTLGRKDYLIDLMAESADAGSPRKTELKIKLYSNGTYYLDSAQLIYVPVGHFQKDTDKLSEGIRTDLKITGNSAKGTLSLSKDRLVTFQILYKKGWKLFVDGEQTQLFSSNGCWLGAYIPEGEHEIWLMYETPGLRVGAMISFVSLLLWCLLAALWLRAKKKEPPVSCFRHRIPAAEDGTV